jgi:hypothetical protein
MMVSIIIPWVRKAGYHRCLSAIFDAVEIGTAFEIVSEEDVDRIGCNPMVNKLIEKARYPIVCFLHDDSEPQQGFLENALSVMRNFKDGVGCVGFNDLIHKEDGPCTHWMIHKDMLEHFPDGVFYSEEYIHTRVDLELKEVSKAAGRYKWAKDAKIKHLNPIYDRKTKRDKVSKHCYDHASLAHDMKTYSRRREEQGGVWDEGRNATEIPIERIFAGRDDYVIIKMSDLFPFFKRGADIDILCRDRERFAGHILKHVRGFEVNRRTKGSHLYVDFYRGKHLTLRFDLIESLDEYGTDASKVFDNRCVRTEGGKSYWVPRDEDELQIRLCEYKKNPKKIWHRKYINQHAPGLLPNLESRTKV